MKSVALLVPEIIAIEVLGVTNPQSWRRGGRRGSGMVPFERALVSSFLPALHSNFSSIFTRFRDIAAFVLQHATFSHPTSSLPKISPLFPDIRWMAFGLRRAKVLGAGIIVRAISFQDFQPTVVLIHQRYRRTDRQRHAILIPRFAL